MTTAADLILTNARVYTLTRDSLHSGGTPDAEAVAIRNGRITAVGSSYDIRFREGVDTRTIDLDGQVLLPGFIDAHTHLLHTGARHRFVDLTKADSRADALEQLTTRAQQSPAADWVLGVGYDESQWADGTLTKAQLNEISTKRPIAAIRVDMHTAVGNTPAIKYCQEQVGTEYIRTDETGTTGVVVEDAVVAIREAVAPGKAGTRDLIETAIEHANKKGITGVHDKTRRPVVARIYRELAAAGALDLRVRVDYWYDHFSALDGLGFRSNSGGPWVTVGGIKMFTDGSIGARTARLTEPYRESDSHGRWVTTPATVENRVRKLTDADFQAVIHAIGDAAVEQTVDILAAADGTRHRIEHAELASDSAIERMAEANIIASVQPNFHRWAGDGGLYAQALGTDRTRQTNRLGRMHEAGVHLAFGSDGMPLDPLYGIEQAVTAPTEAQSLSVGAAVRAYTHGSAYAAFDEKTLGTIEPGTHADMVVLDQSPWTDPSSISDSEVLMTLVDGTVVYDHRE